MQPFPKQSHYVRSPALKLRCNSMWPSDKKVWRTPVLAKQESPNGLFSDEEQSETTHEYQNDEFNSGFQRPRPPIE